MGIITRAAKGLFIASSAVAIVAGGVWAGTPARAADAETSQSGSDGWIQTQTATFQWGLNDESGGGAYFGGCNFLSAGTAGDTGSSRLWSESDEFYQTVDGDVTVLKPDSSDSLTQPTWSTKCQNKLGTNINGRTSGLTMTVDGVDQPAYSGNVVRIANGSGTLDPSTNSAEIQWVGSFTTVYYGGLTYWTITDPRLSVVNGVGTITGTASGYGADMDDPSKWVTLNSTTIHLADLSDVTVTDSGISVTPDFLGVAVSSEITGRNAQAERTAVNASWWGAFPESWVQFAMLTGQSSYWYTSDGAEKTIQPRKPASSITITAGAIPQIQLSAASVAPGDSVTVTGSGLASGASYSLDLIGADGKSVSLGGPTEMTADESGAGTATVTIPATTAGGLYTVRLLDSASQSIATVSFPIGHVPSAPTGLSAGTVSGTSIDLTWSVPSDVGDPALTQYGATATPQGSDSGAVSANVGESGQTSGTLTGLSAGTTYDVTVAAANIVGTGPASSSVEVVVPETPDTPDGDVGSLLGQDLSDVTLRWGMNDEVNSKSFYGGCNYLVAGKAGDSGSARVWTSADVGTLYKASDGNVSIQKPNANGNWVESSWDTRCQDRNGDAVSMTWLENSRAMTSESQVVITSGTGKIADDGSTTVQWTGSWTVAFYDGMTYWSVSDPKLTLDATGKGQLTATASGYGADMDNLTTWDTLESTTIVLADLTGVDVTQAASDHGLTQTPEYLGVTINDTGGRNSQSERSDANAAYWGSFPQSFIDFQVKTGQSSYWYSSDGQRDKAKPATDLTIAYDATYETPVPSSSTPKTTTSGVTSDSMVPGATATTPKAAAAPQAAPEAAAPAANGAAAPAPQAAAAPASSNATDSAGKIALGAGGVALASGAPLAAAWVIRRRLGLDPGFELTQRASR